MTVSPFATFEMDAEGGGAFPSTRAPRTCASRHASTPSTARAPPSVAICFDGHAPAIARKSAAYQAIVAERDVLIEKCRNFNGCLDPLLNPKKTKV